MWIRHVALSCAIFLSSLASPAVRADELRIRLENNYFALLNFGFLGEGQRRGTDIADGTLRRQADGSWVGEVEASVDMTQRLQGLGRSCPETRFRGTQRLRVTAIAAPAGFASIQTITYRIGRANGGHLELLFDAAREPVITPSGPCLDLYQRDPDGFQFLPLNDTRWTDTQARYVIGIPQRGTLEYDDVTADTTAGGSGAATTGLPAEAFSRWTIRIARP